MPERISASLCENVKSIQAIRAGYIVGDGKKNNEEVSCYVGGESKNEDHSKKENRARSVFPDS